MAQSFRLTVVVPVFNRALDCARAVASVLAQGVEDIEILVVDDGSAAPLAPESLPGSDHVHVLRHEINRGAAAARNTGLGAARGTWVAFLDSDDVWAPDTLQRRLNAAEARAASGENPLTVFVSGFTLVRNGGAETRIPVSSRNPLDFASGCWFSPGSTALFQRGPILDAVGPQDETLRRFEDNDWFLRLALAGGQVVALPDLAAVVNLGGKPSLNAVMDSGLKIIRKYEALTLEPELHVGILRRLRAWFALERASVEWYSGRRWRALTDVSRSFWFAPRLQLHVSAFWHERRTMPHQTAL